MKILVFAERLDLGGSQVNAIELSAMLRDRYGHDVVIFAAPGPMSKTIEEKGIRYLPAPERPSRIFPSPRRMRALADAVERERPDLIHVWDWTQCLDAFYGVYLFKCIPMIVSSMTMTVDRLLPKSLPTTFGIPILIDQAKDAGRPKLELIIPPVDVELNSPDVIESKPFRDRFGLGDNDIVLVSVSRLVEWMKAEGICRVIDVVRRVGHELPLKFVIVGEGPSYAKLSDLAEEVNTELGRQAVILSGGLIDPRPAYAAADIVIGMGGSALRAMAIGKPVVVIGERGFAKPFNQETADYFYYHGIFGQGDGDKENINLSAIIRKLAENPGEHDALGKFARDFVVEHFSLGSVCQRLENFIQSSTTEAPSVYSKIIDGIRTGLIIFGQACIPENLRQLIKRRVLKK